MQRSTFQWKKGFSVKRGEGPGGNSVNPGLGKDFYRKGNSVKRSGPFSEPPDSEKWKVAVLIPFPKISSDLICPLTKLLLTKNYSETIVFLTNFARNFQKLSFFPGDFESANSLKIFKELLKIILREGIIFARISCRRVKEIGRTVCKNSSENCLRKLFLLEWVVWGVASFPWVCCRRASALWARPCRRRSP